MRPRGEKFLCALAVRRAGAIGGEPCGGVAGGRGRRAAGGAAAHQPVEHLEQERPASGSGRSWSAARAAQAMRPAS